MTTNGMTQIEQNTMQSIIKMAHEMGEIAKGLTKLTEEIAKVNERLDEQNVLLTTLNTEVVMLKSRY